ncbi:MAG: hypothetical protein U0T81_01845 [Saprospiraceae bacterium]
MLNKSSETYDVALKVRYAGITEACHKFYRRIYRVTILAVMGPGFTMDDWAALFAAVIIVYNSN